MSTSSPDIIGVMNAFPVLQLPYIFVGKLGRPGRNYGHSTGHTLVLMNSIPLEPCLANGGPNLLGKVETLVTGYVNILANFEVDVDVYNYPRCR